MKIHPQPSVLSCLYAAHIQTITTTNWTNA